VTTTTSGLTAVQRRRRRATSLLLPKPGGSAIGREPRRERPRLAVYVRLSLEKDGSVSIARQRATLEQYVTELGGVYDPAADYFEDDDVSAKGTVYRPAAEELLTRVNTGAYDGVVVWEFARFMRTVRETHIACGLMREHAVELYSFEERHLTLYGPGRIALEFAADQAEKELLKLGARVAAARAFLAQYGPAPAHAPFGTVKVEVPSPISGRTAPLHRLVPDETPRESLGGRSPADLVRDAARRVADGESLRAVATSWHRAGYTTTSGAEWAASGISQLLRNPVLAGHSVHRGEVVTDDDGRPQVFHEPPVLEASTWADLSAVLAGRQARPRSGADSPLRGLLRCGRCGAGMTRTNPGATGVYRCWRRDHGGCAGNAIAGRKTEAYIVEAALTLLADPELLARTRHGGDPQAAAARQQREVDAHRLRTALERLELAWVMGQYDDGDGQRRYAKLKAQLVTELDEVLATERRSQARRRTSLTPADGVGVAEAFAALSPAQRLTVLVDVVEHVTVLPAPVRTAAKGTRPTYRPERLVITWQQGEL
jgi:DNA invertase Pin-like site-specific DNA recombinase